MLVDCLELEGVEPLREVGRPLVDDFRRKPVIREVRERPRHLVDCGSRKGRNEVIAAPKHRKG